MAETMTGSCKCGEVRYQIAEPIEFAANCHCNMCKKLTGGPFSSVAVVSQAGFAITQGQDQVSSYAVSENARRHFCRTCGSPIYLLHEKLPGRCMVALGTLDQPTAVTPAMNIHCENMLPWVREIMNRTNFDQGPSV
jgi:hypothetical protein